MPPTMSSDRAAELSQATCSELQITTLAVVLVVLGVLVLIFCFGWKPLKEIKKQIKEIKKQIKELGDKFPKQDNKPKVDPVKTTQGDNKTELEDMTDNIKTGLDIVKQEKKKKKSGRGNLTLDEQQQMLDDNKKWEEVERIFDALKLKTELIQCK